MVQPNIAVTYNKNIGGPVTSVRKVISTSGANLIDCDYRQLLPAKTDIDTIYKSNELLEQTFQEAKANADQFISRHCIDGLVLSGNPANIDPRLFGQAINKETIDLPRAIAEMALIHCALEKGIPLLGICGGLQILNVYLGGTIRDLSATDLKQHGFFKYDRISINPNSMLASIMDPKRNASIQKLPLYEDTFSCHYQVIGNLGGKKQVNEREDLIVAAAQSQEQGHSIEGVESQFGVPIIATQFHPEVAVYGCQIDQLPKPLNGEVYIARDLETLMHNKNIFYALIQAAQSLRDKKAVNRTIKILNNSNESSYLTMLDALRHPRVHGDITHEPKDSSTVHANASTAALTPASPEVKQLLNKITDDAVEKRLQLLKTKAATLPQPNQPLPLRHLFANLPIHPQNSDEEKITKPTNVRYTL